MMLSAIYNPRNLSPLLSKLPPHERLRALTLDIRLETLTKLYKDCHPEHKIEPIAPDLTRFFSPSKYPEHPFAVISSNIAVLEMVFEQLPENDYFKAFQLVSFDSLKTISTKPDFASFMEKIIQKFDPQDCKELLADPERTSLLPDSISDLLRIQYQVSDPLLQ